MLDLETYILLSAAAFAAGGLNALAGGGTFVTLPALIFAGLPPVVANATSAAVVLPGYGSAAFGFRALLLEIKPAKWFTLITTTVMGAVAGAQLLVGTSDATFNFLAPLLVLLATGLFALGPRLTPLLSMRGAHRPWLGITGIGITSAYGGYFNGGLGIALLAVLQLYRSGDEDHSLGVLNGLKSAISFVLTSISVVVFTLAGLIQWQNAVLMMLFSVAGGYAGARFSLRLSSEHLRRFVILLGLVMSLVLFYRFLVLD